MWAYLGFYGWMGCKLFLSHLKRIDIEGVPKSLLVVQPTSDLQVKPIIVYKYQLYQ